MKLMTLVPVTCVLLVGWVSGASAASLSIDAADEVTPPEVEVEVAYSGIAEGQQSYLQISAVKGATSCAPTHDEYDTAGSDALRTGPIVLPAGSFSAPRSCTTRARTCRRGAIWCAPTSSRAAASILTWWPPTR
jgi:hypothetical protein